MQIGETLDDRFTCALHLQRERAEVSPVRRVSALRRQSGGRPEAGCLTTAESVIGIGSTSKSCVCVGQQRCFFFACTTDRPSGADHCTGGSTAVPVT